MSNNFLKKLLLPFAVAVIVSLCSCSSLSKAQLESVAKFAETCDSFSAYPSLIFYELNQIRKESAIWYAASLTIPENRVGEIIKTVEFNKGEDKIANAADISLKILVCYSSALKSLAHQNRITDPGREIRSAGRAVDTLITSFNSLKITKPISTGIISTSARLVAYGVELNATRARAEALRKFIPAGDTLINELCVALESLLKGDEVKSLIEHEQEMLQNNYLSYVRVAGSNIQEDRRFAEFTERATDLSKLRTSTITSIGALRRAHNKLTTMVDEGISLLELIKDIEGFGKEVEKLHKATKKWKRNQ